MNTTTQLSVLIPVLDRVDDLKELHAGYEQALAGLGLTYEVIFVVDGGNVGAYDTLAEMNRNGATSRSSGCRRTSASRRC